MIAAAAAVHAAPAAGAVERLLRASRAALGASALARPHVIELRGSIVQSGLPGEVTQWVEIGGLRFAETIETPPVGGADGFDGRAVWNRDTTGVVWNDGGEAGRALGISNAFVMTDALWSPGRGGAVVRWGGMRVDRGERCETLEIRAPGSAVPLVLWFDRRTHLPIRWTMRIGPDATATTMSEYHDVAGLKVPYRWVTASSDGNTTEVRIARAIGDPAGGRTNVVRPLPDVRDFSIVGGSSTRVPFELIENHVALDVTLNGKGPYHFLFDTGGENFVDTGVAREIGVVGSGSMQGGGVGNTTVAMSNAEVTSLGVGNARLAHQPFVVAPVHAGFALASGRVIDGLIGFEVLARFATTFDYEHRVITLALPGTEAPPGPTIPFVFDGKQPQFGCAIDALAAQCTLDTGSRDAISLFTPFIAAHPQVVPARTSAVGINGFGVGGPALGRLGRLRSVTLAGHGVPNVIADFSVQTQGAFAQPFVAANVGGALLRRFTLWTDYPKSRMALVPNADFGAPDAYERAGLFLVSVQGRAAIADVRPGTPAQAAGLRKRDVIVAVDGRDTAKATLDDVRRAFRGPAGTLVRLEVLRAGKLLGVTLRLRDYV